ncbi:MAG: hypothetical protein K0S08_2169 [Gammaproteobacteria bacterium]|jgi:hypothetical protein|nr:hypothetical protein [Gammaproteobacteria bacterium]
MFIENKETRKSQRALMAVDEVRSLVETLQEIGKRYLQDYPEPVYFLGKIFSIHTNQKQARALQNLSSEQISSEAQLFGVLHAIRKTMPKTGRLFKEMITVVRSKSNTANRVVGNLEKLYASSGATAAIAAYERYDDIFYQCFKDLPGSANSANQEAEFLEAVIEQEARLNPVQPSHHHPAEMQAFASNNPAPFRS